MTPAQTREGLHKRIDELMDGQDINGYAALVAGINFAIDTYAAAVRDAERKAGDERVAAERAKTVGQGDLIEQLRLYQLAALANMKEDRERISGLRSDVHHLAIRAGATHRCAKCGAFWRLHIGPDAPDGYWNLVSLKAGACCDNAEIADQMERLGTRTDVSNDRKEPSGG